MDSASVQEDRSQKTQSLLMGSMKFLPWGSLLGICMSLCEYVMTDTGTASPRDRIPWLRWPISTGVRPGTILPEGPASVLQAVVTP